MCTSSKEWNWEVQRNKIIFSNGGFHPLSCFLSTTHKVKLWLMAESFVLQLFNQSVTVLTWLFYLTPKIEHKCWKLLRTTAFNVMLVSEEENSQNRQMNVSKNINLKAKNIQNTQKNQSENIHVCLYLYHTFQFLA